MKRAVFLRALAWCLGISNMVVIRQVYCINDMPQEHVDEEPCCGVLEHLYAVQHGGGYA